MASTCGHGQEDLSGNDYTMKGFEYITFEMKIARFYLCMYNIPFYLIFKFTSVTFPSAVLFRQVSGTRRIVLEIVQQPQPERS